MVADVSARDGHDALLGACPEPDILVNNNGGPPFRNFRELSREDLLRGVIMNMVTPIELIQRVIDGMAARQFGRIVNITSSSCSTARSTTRDALGSSWRTLPLTPAGPS